MRWWRRTWGKEARFPENVKSLHLEENFLSIKLVYRVYIYMACDTIC